MYVPVNVEVYLAAYSGCIAGIGTANRVIQSIVPGDYTFINKVADAYGQSFDTIYNKVSPNIFQLEEVQTLSEEFWVNRSPSIPGVDDVPTTYNGSCAAIKALMTQADTQVAS